MKLNYTKIGIVLALLALFVLSACGKSDKNDTNPPSTPSQGEGGGATKEITEKAVNWSFSEPEIQANVGDTLKLTLNNETGVHGLVIEDLGVDLKNGETATIKLDKAGTYEFHCSIQCGQGHDNMVGQIVVQ